MLQIEQKVVGQEKRISRESWKGNEMLRQNGWGSSEIEEPKKMTTEIKFMPNRVILFHHRYKFNNSKHSRMYLNV
jgi:hypothetical protein